MPCTVMHSSPTRAEKLQPDQQQQQQQTTQSSDNADPSSSPVLSATQHHALAVAVAQHHRGSRSSSCSSAVSTISTSSTISNDAASSTSKKRKARACTSINDDYAVGIRLSTTTAALPPLSRSTVPGLEPCVSSYAPSTSIRHNHFIQVPSSKISDTNSVSHDILLPPFKRTRVQDAAHNEHFIKVIEDPDAQMATVPDTNETHPPISPAQPAYSADSTAFGRNLPLLLREEIDASRAPRTSLQTLSDNASRQSCSDTLDRRHVVHAFADDSTIREDYPRKRASSLPLQDEIYIFGRSRRPKRDLRRQMGSMAHRTSETQPMSNGMQRQSGAAIPVSRKQISQGDKAGLEREEAIQIDIHDCPRRASANPSGIQAGARGSAAVPSTSAEIAGYAQSQRVCHASTSKAAGMGCGNAALEQPLSHTQLVALHQLNLPRPPLLLTSSASSSASSAACNQPHSRSLSRHSIHARKASNLPGANQALRAVAATSNARSHAVTISSTTLSVPSLNPPITKETMKELDLSEVLQCRQLRHDVVFDVNLAFRPNLDGDRYEFPPPTCYYPADFKNSGDRKREAADRYWEALARELDTGCRCTTYPHPPSAAALHLGKKSLSLPCICRPAISPASIAMTVPAGLATRLPSRVHALVVALRDILLSIVPSNDDTATSTTPGKGTHELLKDTLDADLIAQEVAHGVYDISALALYLGHLLKTHCAPMRDEMIDNMVQAIQCGQQKNDSIAVATGLRKCFSVLELMKLDIANHQLRTLRPWLLETAAEFQLNSFCESAMAKDFSETTKRTSDWIRKAIQSATTQEETASYASDNLLDIVSCGIMDLLFSAEAYDPAARLEEKTASSGLHASRTAEQVANAQRRSRDRRARVPPLLSASQIPETLSLDSARLQALHADIVEACVIHLLVLLYRQLRASAHRGPASVVEIDKLHAEIRVIVTDLNINAASLPTDIRKLRHSTWQESMKPALLHLANRAAPPDSPTVPDQATLDLLYSWWNKNVDPDGSLVR